MLITLKANKLDHPLFRLIMVKLQLTGRNLGRVFNFRKCCVHAVQLEFFETKLPDLKLKTRTKQVLGSLPLDITIDI